MAIKLNLGCGFDHKPQSEGWINIDKDINCHPDIVWDLDKYEMFGHYLPGFVSHKEQQVEEVLIKHCLEHLNQSAFFGLLKELWHECKSNATITIIVPHWQQEAAFEPDHKWVYPPRSFRMICDESYKHLVTPAQFEIVELIEKDDAKEPQTKVVYKVIK